MRRTFILVIISMVIAVCAAGKKTQTLDWQTGTLLKVSMTTDKSYGTGKEMGLDGKLHDTLEAKRDDATFYEIDAGEFIYVAKRTLLSWKDRQLRVTTGAKVKFAIKGDDFYLMDEDGKYHILSIEEKKVKK